LDISKNQREEYQKQASQQYKLIQKSNIQLLVLGQKGYPQSLLALSDAPPILYAKGQISLLDQLIVAVVGSRKPTEYGSQASRYLVEQFVAQGTVIASGMAMGIDTVAHQSCLAAGGHTIAVLGCSIDLATSPLAHTISQDGLLLSHFPLGTTPQKFTFPARNRLLAGISQAVVVAQAGAKSGSLLTARAAIDYHKLLFAVPGSIFHPGNAGSHQLLEQGAKPAVDAAAIVSTLTRQKSDTLAAQPQSSALTAPEEKIFHLLQSGPLSVDLLIRRSQLSAAEVLSIVSVLELKGVIVNTEGEYRISAQTPASRVKK
jgi:DNA processing protein